MTTAQPIAWKKPNRSWRKDVVTLLANFSMPDIALVYGSLSYYQQKLGEDTFSPVVLLDEKYKDRNPQGAAQKNVYFLMQSDALQIFDNNGDMIYDRGTFTANYKPLDAQLKNIAAPEMTPDFVSDADWTYWCVMGFTVRVFTDMNIHAREEDYAADLRLA